MSYLAKQGLGQLSLLHRAKPNKEVLDDVAISKLHKNKIRLVKTYKKYFYKYWKRKETQIYTKTTILKSDAVTYLVTGSKHNHIAAYRTSFPFMGSFPYLGFFSLESAKEFQSELENKDYVTFIRPVYAYSTLGYFTDTILSSFFKYDDYELAELVFHELFHTIFFIKDEIGINENLANYFAVKMVEGYFKSSTEEISRKKKQDKKYKELKKEIYKLVLDLNLLYAKYKPQDKAASQEILSNFLKNKFMPKIRKSCGQLKIDIKKCYPLKRKWNNARFVGFLTYEQDVNTLEAMQKRLKLNINDFFAYIENSYKKYESSNKKKTFRSELFKL